MIRTEYTEIGRVVVDATRYRLYVVDVYDRLRGAWAPIAFNVVHRRAPIDLAISTEDAQRKPPECLRTEDSCVRRAADAGFVVLIGKPH